MFPAARRPECACRARIRGARLRGVSRLDPHARLFAWFKLRVDPMFPRLHELVGTRAACSTSAAGRRAGAWLLAKDLPLTVHGAEPDPARARSPPVPSGPRGTAVQSRGPRVAGDARAGRRRAALDVIHHPTDDELWTTLRDLLGCLTRRAPFCALPFRAGSSRGCAASRFGDPEGRSACALPVGRRAAVRSWSAPALRERIERTAPRLGRAVVQVVRPADGARAATPQRLPAAIRRRSPS